MIYINNNDLNQATTSAIKWSSIGEIISKIINPIINMILARILAPEAFGILATITMVISFAEIFVESGFQKYLIQHIFKNKKEEHEYMSVAFWTNLFFSLIIWVLIIIFNGQIATIVGNPDLGHLIIISGVTIPMYGIIGIQSCELTKNLEFKKLFYVKFVAALVPLLVTLPLAVAGFDYWSLIIGNIAGIGTRVFILVIVGKFKPKLFFKFDYLKTMMSFGIWTMLDGIAIWMTSWVDSLLIATYMDEYHLGLYKNSSSIIVALFAIVTSALLPVLFSVLSKLQNDTEAFNKMFLNTQKMLAIFLFPLGIGVYLYRDFATEILLGASWQEAADIIGIMGLMTALRTVFISPYSDAYRAKGRFYLPLVLQVIDIVILIPVCVISVKLGFWTLVYARAFVKLDLLIPEIIFVWIVCKINPKMTLKALFPAILSTSVMTLVAIIIKDIVDSYVWQIVTILICIVIYFSVLFCFADERNKILIPFIDRILKRRKKDV